MDPNMLKQQQRLARVSKHQWREALNGLTRHLTKKLNAKLLTGEAARSAGGQPAQESYPKNEQNQRTRVMGLSKTVGRLNFDQMSNAEVYAVWGTTEEEHFGKMFALIDEENAKVTGATRRHVAKAAIPISTRKKAPSVI